MIEKENDPEYKRLLAEVMQAAANRNTAKWRQQKMQQEAHKFAARLAAQQRWK